MGLVIAVRAVIGTWIAKVRTLLPLRASIPPVLASGMT